MTNSQFNDYEMEKTVYAMLQSEPTVTAEFEAFGEFIPLFGASIAEVKRLNMEYEKATKGLTKAKHDALEAVFNGIHPVKAALFSISHKLSDEKLKALVSMTDSKLKKLREEKFIEGAGVILQAGYDNITPLGKYKITTEKLDGIKANLDLLHGKEDEQSTGFTNRNSLWMSLNKELEKTHEILTIHLDAIAECTHDDHVDFYNKYKAARVVKNLGGNHNGGEDETPPAAPEPPK
ncbi:MAG: hypothetical protein M1480_00945 [Bacteroidetes bacterium]|nr:hypothetical protein [Bacteroidota bacterium]